MRYILLICCCIFLQANCLKTALGDENIDLSNGTDNIKGLNFVAPPDPFQTDPMPAVKAVNAEWIAVIPFGFTRLNEPSVRYDMSNWQWWGERKEGVKETIRLAQQSGIKIMLKPQVYIPGSWPGGLDFDEEGWIAWESDYRKYVMAFVEIATEMDVEMFCVGTEFKQSSTKRPEFWRQLIAEVKAKYNGKLTYAANWDEYPGIDFWDDLDYIGVDAYFPLVNQVTPSVDALTSAWKPLIDQMKSISSEWNKQILFTEYGYLSVDRCAYNTWELEQNIKSHKINEQAQANAYDGLFEALWYEECWAGGFVWKWFPNMQGHENYIERDYTPQGKLAEAVLQKWYSK